MQNAGTQNATNVGMQNAECWNAECNKCWNAECNKCWNVKCRKLSVRHVELQETKGVYDGFGAIGAIMIFCW